jgi:ethanolamine ammonia-lyase small subunit
VKAPVIEDAWSALRQFTRARIALGRAGNSLPTQALLQFGLAHAQARDAVYLPFDAATLAEKLQRDGYQIVQVQSCAQDRQHYLLRPDYGRQLDEISKENLKNFSSSQAYDIVFVVADGLAPQAPLSLAAPLLQALRPQLSDWTIGPIVIASQARVALSDEIGAALNAEMVVILIGERPGLSSPCSLGAYLTYAPRTGRSDAERNCISNIHAEGLSCEDAAAKLFYLMNNARTLKLSGVGLKDDSDISRLNRGGEPDMFT